MIVDLTPETNRIKMIWGNNVNLYITVNQCVDDDDQANLTGASAVLTLKRRLEDTDTAAIIQKSGNNLIVDPSSGLVKISIVPADTTTSLPNSFRPYYFDLQIKDASNNFVTSGMGVLYVYPGVTNAKT